MTTKGFIDVLKTGILGFAERNPRVIVVFHKGDCVIEEGVEGTEIFLIKQGTLSVSVKDPVDRAEKDVALRFDGDLIGETAILQRRGRRNATVQVVSPMATLIRMSNQDVLALIRSEASVAEAIVAVWELAAARRAETKQILGGDVQVENRVMSVLMADIHNFSMLGEVVWEELSESFLFEFIDTSAEISSSFDSTFERPR